MKKIHKAVSLVWVGGCRGKEKDKWRSNVGRWEAEPQQCIGGLGVHMPALNKGRRKQRIVFFIDIWGQNATNHPWVYFLSSNSFKVPLYNCLTPCCQNSNTNPPTFLQIFPLHVMMQKPICFHKLSQNMEPSVSCLLHKSYWLHLSKRSGMLIFFAGVNSSLFPFPSDLHIKSHFCVFFLKFPLHIHPSAYWRP